MDKANKKMRVGQRITGTYMDMRFSGTVTNVRLVDNYGRAADLGEATIEVDNPESLGGRELLFPALTPDLYLVDSRYTDVRIKGAVMPKTKLAVKTDEGTFVRTTTTRYTCLVTYVERETGRVLDPSFHTRMDLARKAVDKWNLSCRTTIYKFDLDEARELGASIGRVKFVADTPHGKFQTTRDDVDTQALTHVVLWQHNNKGIKCDLRRGDWTLKNWFSSQTGAQKDFDRWDIRANRNQVDFDAWHAEHKDDQPHPQTGWVPRYSWTEVAGPFPVVAKKIKKRAPKKVA